MLHGNANSTLKYFPFLILIMNAIMKRKRHKVGLGLSGPLDDSVISNLNSELVFGCVCKDNDLKLKNKILNFFNCLK